MAHSSPNKAIQLIKKGPWSQAEDDSLIRLVGMYGPEQWMEISKDHGSRNAKQCRERYHQNLKPTINRGPISAEEGVIIERLHAEKGPKWAEISRALGGRSDNQVKNWYNGQKNRRTKMHAHLGQQVILHGYQNSVSAVKPVDMAMLRQRGHINPYPQGNVGHYHNPRPSPTTSQISEAPSLISDASSASPGISPSSITAYPASSNGWPAPDAALRSNLPSLHHLPALLPPHTAAACPVRSPTSRQIADPTSLEPKQTYVAERLDPLRPQQNLAHFGAHGPIGYSRPPHTLDPSPGQLPPVQSLLEPRSRSGAQTHDESPTAPIRLGPSRRTLPRLYASRDGASRSLHPPLYGHLRVASSCSPRSNNRHTPYPLSTHPTTTTVPHDTMKGRMSLANVLG